MLLNLKDMNSYRRRVICFNHLFFHPCVENRTWVQSSTRIKNNTNCYWAQSATAEKAQMKLPWANCPICLARPWATAEANQSSHIGISGSFCWIQPDGRIWKAKIIWLEMKPLTSILEESFSIFCLPWQTEQQALQPSAIHPDCHWLHKEHASTHATERSRFKDLQRTHRRWEETTATSKDHHTRVKMWATLLPVEGPEIRFLRIHVTRSMLPTSKLSKKTLKNYARVWQHSRHGDLDEAVYQEVSFK